MNISSLQPLNERKYLFIVFATILSAILLMASIGPSLLAAATDDEDEELEDLLDEVKDALEKYEDPLVAIADGYAPTEECVFSPAGTMGFHYANFAEVDGVIDPFQPEVLVYLPTDDGLKLVAVEYIADVAGLTVFGQPMAPGPFPGLHELHVWFFEDNPTGIFQDWNPAISCFGEVDDDSDSDSDSGSDDDSS